MTWKWARNESQKVKKFGRAGMTSGSWLFSMWHRPSVCMVMMAIIINTKKIRKDIFSSCREVLVSALIKCEISAEDWRSLSIFMKRMIRKSSRMILSEPEGPPGSM